jgi:hypothetical protein
MPEMTLKELYRSAQTAGAEGKAALQLLDQTNWFTINADFDPKTGDALPQPLSSFLARIVDQKPPGVIRDRLYLIAELARPAVKRLLRQLNESPRREHALLPVRAVREIDASSFIKLSTRPGRNIREKLAGKPYLQAVRRFQSVDLPENRLLKAYVSRLSELLEMRQDILGEPEDELIPQIRSWLISDEAKAIARWENLPPNNTLLSHRDYGLVWDAWRRLQTLDDDIACDLSRLAVRRSTMQRWTDHGRMYLEGTHLFAEMPVLFDYDEFTIRTWSAGPIVQKAARRIDRSTETRAIRQVVCLDLSEAHPLFADNASGSRALTETFLWQRWKNDADTVDIPLFTSDAAYLHPDASTIASSDLFFATDVTRDYLDRAARAYADRLRDTFKDDKFIWLVPDALNDFELETIRRNLNARFPGAEPLPRSVAAAFEQVDYSRISKDGYPIVVVDTIGGRTCVTKLIARFDADLEKRSPETRGYYWERCPPVLLSKRDFGEDRRYDMVTVSGDGKWRDRALPERPQSIDPQLLKEDQRIGRFELCINLSSTPVAGGMRLHSMQARAGNISLWRDQIPELSIKVIKDGHPHRFFLVSHGTTIKPIRGQSVRIKIDEHFTLPAGKRFYQFPLYQGENAAELRFSARLDSPAFPLASDTECELILTFQYGDDEPYTLMFAPLDDSFPPVRTTWKPTIEIVVNDAPAPSYPTPLSWDGLQRMPKPDSNETSDLLEWVVSAIDHMDQDLFIRPVKRTIGQISSTWLVDKNNMHYTFAQCSEAKEDVFIHEGNFVSDCCYRDYKYGDSISFRLQERVGSGPCGFKVATSDYVEPVRMREFDSDGECEFVSNIHRRLYFPIIQVWRDGRSIKDRQCPKEFTKAAKEKIAYLSELLGMKELPQAVKSELLFLLSCLHQDAPNECVKWITGQVEDDDIRDRRAVGYALGDVAVEWQHRILRSLSSSPDNSAIRIFAYAIWRTQHFVERFSYKELELLLPFLLARIVHLQPQQSEEGRRFIAVNPLELLLGLLRTRASDDPDIRMLLQPHQKITKQFADQIERIEAIIAEKHIKLFSRIQINIQKPEGVRTPDLLYALRLYLTGDDGANSIYITGISDSDDN